MKSLRIPFALLACLTSAHVQAKEAPPLPLIGQVQPRDATEIESSNWLVGCETLDRDFADYDAYKEHLTPLGIKRIRLQAGWNKTERTKGHYDWAWLDHIVNDATGRGLEPWMQLSYGNESYPDGGGANLGAGLPVSPEALQAWDKWVAAIVSRYKDRVTEWEIWNEPNFADNLENTPEVFAAFSGRTIDIIKSVQPEAKVSGLAMGHISLEYADTFFRILHEQERLELFDNITYHDYVYNPDSHYPKVMKLKKVLEKYAPEMPLRQGENGAPSAGGMGGAIGLYDWTELSQAKWDVRRMLGDLGHDIETSIFTIIDIAYSGSGPIDRLNVKGLIESNSSKKAIRRKKAYFAVQHVASIFDHALDRIQGVERSYNIDQPLEAEDGVLYTLNTDMSYAVYGYRHRDTGQQLYTIWNKECIPSNENKYWPLNVSFKNAKFEDPVCVDVITGEIRDIPDDRWSKDGAIYTFNAIPVYDGPILIADRSLIP